MLKQRIKNLVFEGGGVKGIAYLGALDTMAKIGPPLEKIARVGGTSAGAIVALLMGLGYSREEMNDILWKLDFNAFKDDDWGLLRNFIRLDKNYGYYKGNFFLEWVGNIIAQKTGNELATFANIQSFKITHGFRDMYFVATNLSQGRAEIFSHEHTPDMPIAYAVRASMSIPLFFASFPYNDNIYVDGGLINNYPVRLFDKVKYLENYAHGITTDYYEKENTRHKHKDSEKIIFNSETLGFRLESSDRIHVLRDHADPQITTAITDFRSYAWALIETVLNSQQDNTHLESRDWQRTIYIDTLDVKTTDFSISNERKQALINSGSEGVKRFFSKSNLAPMVQQDQAWENATSPL